MRRSTAIGHLVEMAEVASQRQEFGDQAQWPLYEMWVTGEILWCYRPRAWPVWTYEHRRAVRFWSVESGLDASAIEALRSRRLERLAIVEPSDHELTTQLRAELAVSREHLRSVLEGYWDRDWRQRHKGYNEYPEDHLWRAATAVAEMLDAVGNLNE